MTVASRLPDPWKPEHHYLLAIRDLIVRQNELLRAILDRLREPDRPVLQQIRVVSPPLAGGGSVELREPDPPAAASAAGRVRGEGTSDVGGTGSAGTPASDTPAKPKGKTAGTGKTRAPAKRATRKQARGEVGAATPHVDDRT